MGGGMGGGIGSHREFSYGGSSVKNPSFGSVSNGSISTSTSISSKNSLTPDYGSNHYKGGLSHGGGSASLRASPNLRTPVKDPGVRKSSFSIFESEVTNTFTPQKTTNKAFGGGFNSNSIANMNKTGGLDFKNIARTTMTNSLSSAKLGTNNSSTRLPNIKAQNNSNVYASPSQPLKSPMKNSYSGLGVSGSSTLSQTNGFKAYQMKKNNPFAY